jgi:3-oxoacyl-[acyl-carrier protein] reductase
MKTVLVTGGSTGIGSSIVERFAKQNYNVVFTYNTNYEKASKLQEEVISKYNVKCMTIKCNLKNEDEINSLVESIYKEFNNIDVLVNNAALELTTEFTNKTKQDFIDVLNVNLVGPFLLSRLVGNKMFENKEGKIINISSNNALDKYDPSTLEYDASKA